MRIFNKFIWSKKEPKNKSDIWFDGKRFNMFSQEEWKPFTATVEDVNRVTQVVDNIEKYIDEKIESHVASVINGATEAYDTLKEIEDYIVSDKEGAISLATRVGNNADAIQHHTNEINEIKDSILNIDVESVYESVIEDTTLTVPTTVGGIEKGTKLEDLNNKSFSYLFDSLLFPTVVPTFTDPSASISLKNFNSVVKLGTTGPTISNFNTSFNRGAINLNGVKQDNRAGELDTEQSYIYVSSGNGSLDGSALSTLGTTNYKYRAYYKEGPQPKDNKGNDYSTPLNAGYKDSSAVSINVTLPWFASTSADGVVEQSLISWNTTAGNMSTGNFVLQPSGTTPQVFKIPRKLNSIQKLNTISGKMEDESKSLYTETTETITINNIDQTYYVYTYNGSDRSDVTLSIKF